MISAYVMGILLAGIYSIIYCLYLDRMLHILLLLLTA